jgi:methylglutaconyl-CoA hydratase
MSEELSNAQAGELSSSLKVLLSESGILHLTMTRPEVHNAFDDHQAKRLLVALDAAASNPAVRVVVIGGEGKSFSAGGDINYMRRMGSNSYEENLADGGQLAKLMRAINFFPKPTIARVQGAAMGGGVGLVACCDIAVGSPKARFCLSEVKLGMAPATISPYVVRTIGEKNARRYFATAEMINADKALAIGLLSELVEEGELDSTIDAICQSILSNAPEAVSKAKELAINVAQGDVTDEMIAYTVKFIADIRDSAEGKEGLTAFLEKRKPAWAV